MVIQVLKPEQGITLCVSVTSATILMTKRTIHKHGLNHSIMITIHKHGLNHGMMTKPLYRDKTMFMHGSLDCEDGCRCDQNT